MNVRTTIDLPVALHGQLRQKAATKGVSIRSLILSAIERDLTPAKKESTLPAR